MTLSTPALIVWILLVMGFFLAILFVAMWGVGA